MAWQLFAMWAIVIGTITWFVRDEKRVKAEAEIAEAARYYAHAPKYRHVSATEDHAEPSEPTRRVGGLSETQRQFLRAMTKAD